MNTHVTDNELTIILLVSMFTILLVLFIVGKWLNFHLFASCSNWIRNRKTSTTVSVREQTTQVQIIYKQNKKKQLHKSFLCFQEPMASFIDLQTIDGSLKNNNNRSLWTPAVGSISSLVTNDTTFDNTPMRSLILFFLIL